MSKVTKGRKRGKGELGDRQEGSKESGLRGGTSAGRGSGLSWSWRQCWRRWWPRRRPGRRQHNSVRWRLRWRSRRDQGKGWRRQWRWHGCVRQRRLVSFLNRPRAITQAGEHSFFSQMTARFCGGGGVPSPLIEPKMGREGKRPT